MRLVDSPVLQRLRYIRQLGLAYLVYPGASHSRFEHALGTYHLARRTLALLDERGELSRVDATECAVIRSAALLHDVGHYPYSHALEEIGAPHHEQIAEPLITSGAVADLLRADIGEDGPARVLALIRGRSASPLQRLISGSLDLDKIEYLKRDAFMCGVPYGEIDVDRLLNSLTLLEEPQSDRLAVGVLEKGLSALESLLFAKYQMYRNVYWHHAVRSATAMYKRLVADALSRGELELGELGRLTDEGLLHSLEQSRAAAPLLRALRERRLYKRLLEISAADLDEPSAEWISADVALAARVEDALALEVGLAPGELLLDYPEKPQMLGLDIPVRQRDGRVRHLTPLGWPGAINLPALSDELYRSARRLRVFTARPVTVSADRVLLAILSTPGEMREKLEKGEALLSE
ncbi:MAG TPA: HD domain-containing protein [Gemmatimonadaceae bacterium]|jgi:HD superfamily phosphohydrolase|nr:HD domain-containing protein [Gemmatimonadaceae bacterium]